VVFSEEIAELRSAGQPGAVVPTWFVLAHQVENAFEVVGLGK
jgi:hypothetical protein